MHMLAPVHARMAKRGREAHDPEEVAAAIAATEAAIARDFLDRSESPEGVHQHLPWRARPSPFPRHPRD
jgi:hypothetical protein